MFRRNFLQRMAFGASAGLPPAQTKTVTYRIQGFTCVTCAVGLDTLLQRQKGVVRCRSNYPDVSAMIEFHPDLITEKELKALIAEMGFAVS